MSGIKHTFNQGAWRYCGRCDRKCKIRDMKWQRGILLCTETCVDRHLIGDREIGIALVLTDGKEELVPPEKLRNPDLHEDAEDFIF